MAICLKLKCSPRASQLGVLWPTAIELLEEAEANVSVKASPVGSGGIVVTAADAGADACVGAQVGGGAWAGDGARERSAVV